MSIVARSLVVLLFSSLMPSAWLHAVPWATVHLGAEVELHQTVHGKHWIKPTSPPIQRLGIEISCPRKDQLIVHEALECTVKLTNEGTETVRLPIAMFAHRHRVRGRWVGTFKSTDSERKLELTGVEIVWSSEGGDEDEPVQPEHSLSRRVSVGYDWGMESRVFSSPGQYTLWVVVREDDHEWTSNRLEVSVAAAPKSEEAALALMDASDCSFLYDHSAFGMGTLAPRLELCQRIADCPGSRVYSYYARIALAQRELDLSFDAGTCTVVHARLSRAKELLQTAEAQHDRMADLTHRLLAEIRAEEPLAECMSSFATATSR